MLEQWTLPGYAVRPHNIFSGVLSALDLLSCGHSLQHWYSLAGDLQILLPKIHYHFWLLMTHLSASIQYLITGTVIFFFRRSVSGQFPSLSLWWLQISSSFISFILFFHPVNFVVLVSNFYTHIQWVLFLKEFAATLWSWKEITFRKNIYLKLKKSCLKLIYLLGCSSRFFKASSS